jgi:hypothetical protein
MHMQQTHDDDDVTSIFLRARVFRTTFRISPVGSFAQEMRATMKTIFENLKLDQEDLDEDDGRLQPPQSINWYPDELAW